MWQPRGHAGRSVALPTVTDFLRSYQRRLIADRSLRLQLQIPSTSRLNNYHAIRIDLLCPQPLMLKARRVLELTQTKDQFTHQKAERYRNLFRAIELRVSAGHINDDVDRSMVTSKVFPTFQPCYSLISIRLIQSNVL